MVHGYRRAGVDIGHQILQRSSFNQYTKSFLTVVVMDNEMFRIIKRVSEFKQILTVGKGN